MGTITAISRAVRHWFGVLWWVFPIIMLVGGLLVPALQTSVTEWPIPEATRSTLYLVLLASVIIAGLWVVSAFFYASDYETGVNALKWDVAVSITLGIGLPSLSVYLFAKEMLLWAFVVPTTAAILDAYITGNRAVNNAAQKPIVQQHPKGS